MRLLLPCKNLVPLRMSLLFKHNIIRDQSLKKKDNFIVKDAFKFGNYIC